VNAARGGLGILDLHEFSQQAGDCFSAQADFAKLGRFWLFEALRRLPTAAACGFDPGCGLIDGRSGVDLNKIGGIADMHACNVFGSVNQPFVVQETNCQFSD